MPRDIWRTTLLAALFYAPAVVLSRQLIFYSDVYFSNLMAYLAAFLPRVAIRTSDEFGIDPDHKEAIAFAVLANESFHGRPANLPSATGAKRPVVLGKLSR